MELTQSERWILTNQFMILEKLYPEHTPSYEKAREILENGYEIAYDWITQHISREGVSEQISSEVLDILSMFHALDNGYKNLSDAEKSEVDDYWVRFPGFDGNNEGKHHSFTLFLIDTEGKFQTLHRGDNFNSHAPLLGRYRQMLVEWEASKDRVNLTSEDIKRITSSE